MCSDRDSGEKSFAVRLLRKRVSRIKSRSRIVRWENRQRKHSKGSWYRLQRLLADAAEMYIIDDETAAIIKKKGFSAHPAGKLFHPELNIFIIPEDQIPDLPEAEKRFPRLTAEMLQERNFILVPFELDDDNTNKR